MRTTTQGQYVTFNEELYVMYTKEEFSQLIEQLCAQIKQQQLQTVLLVQTVAQLQATTIRQEHIIAGLRTSLSEPHTQPQITTDTTGHATRVKKKKVRFSKQQQTAQQPDALQGKNATLYNSTTQRHDLWNTTLFSEESTSEAIDPTILQAARAAWSK